MSELDVRAGPGGPMRAVTERFVSTSARVWCPHDGLVEPELNPGDGVDTVHCSRCFELVGVLERRAVRPSPRARAGSAKAAWAAERIH